MHPPNAKKERKKTATRDAAAMSAPDTLRMATLGAALAMGREQEIGSIEVGKQADLICVRQDSIEAAPCFEAVSQIVYSTGRSQVQDVWIAGRRKLDDGQLVDFDVQCVRAKAVEWQRRIEALPLRGSKA